MNITDGVEQFSMGYWVVALAAVTSLIGVFVGVASGRKALMAVTPKQRWSWMAWSSLSISAVGAWLPHYIGMVGFSLEESGIRYDLTWVALSIVVAVIAAGLALWIVNPAPTRHRMPTSSIDVIRLLAGTAVLGFGLTMTHFCIVRSVQIEGVFSYDPALTSAAIVAGVVASAAMLMSVQALDSRTWRAVSAVAIAALLVAMHYLAMFGLNITLDPTATPPTGYEVFSILFPVFVMTFVILTIPITALLMAPDRVAAALEREADALAAESRNLDVGVDAEENATTARRR